MKNWKKKKLKRASQAEIRYCKKAVVVAAAKVVMVMIAATVEIVRIVVWLVRMEIEAVQHAKRKTATKKMVFCVTSKAAVMKKISKKIYCNKLI